MTLEEAIYGLRHAEIVFGRTTGKMQFLEALKLVLDAAEAQEVKHGEWIKNESGYYECSNCGSIKPYDGIGVLKPEWVTYWECDYCRYCGAEMDGKDKRQ